MDGPTDRHDEVSSLFNDFLNSPRKWNLTKCVAQQFLTALPLKTGPIDSRNVCKQLRTCYVTAVKREGLQLIYHESTEKSSRQESEMELTKTVALAGDEYARTVCTYVILRRIRFCFVPCIRPTRSSMCLLPTNITMVIQTMLHDTTLSSKRTFSLN